MISFSDALSLIALHPVSCKFSVVNVLDAQGLHLAQTVMAPINLPPFNNSAVDGFAVLAKTCAHARELPVITSLRAALQPEFTLPTMTTAKIMTGAPIPNGADAVVMKEDVELTHDVAHFKGSVTHHDNIRFAGEDIKRGEIVATPGTPITPQLIAVLLGLGIDRVCVIKPPTVAIIATGDELIEAGQPLQFGQVYYLVGPMLRAQCQALGMVPRQLIRVSDNEDELRDALRSALACDVVLIAGGMSKGDHDVVRPALKKCDVTEIFYEGAWRPGKPLFFGSRDHTRVFGLPGNPVAAFVCFQVFVRQLIENALCPKKNPTKSAVLRTTYEKKTGFTFFLRATVTSKNELFLLPGQGSHQIFSLSRANALCVLNPEKAIVKAGEVVQYYPI